MSVYIDPPTIPEGMTVDEYRRGRTQQEARRILSRVRQLERDLPRVEFVRVPAAPWLRITRIDSPAMSRHQG